MKKLDKTEKLAKNALMALSRADGAAYL